MGVGIFFEREFGKRYCSVLWNFEWVLGMAMTLDGGWLIVFLDRWGEGIDGWGFFGTVIISFVRGASVNLVYDERVAFVDVASDAGGYGLRPAAAG